MAVLPTRTFFRQAFLGGAVCALLVGAISMPGFADEQTSIKIGIEGGFPPFSYFDAHNKLQGFDVDIANALCEAGTLKCEFVVHKWDNIIPDLLAGQYDVIISSMSMSAERRKLVDFSDKYYNSPSIFIAPKGKKFADAKPETLKGLRIGVAYDTVQAAYVDKFYRPIADVTVFPTSADLYKGLEEGKVDIIMEDKLAIFDWLNNTKAGGCCEFVGSDISDNTYFGEGAGIALRPEDDKLRERLNGALAKIQSDGTYDMINAEYFPFSIQ